MEDTTTVETTTETAPEAGAETTVETTVKPADDPRISKANKEAADYRKRLRAAEAELEKVRQASLTETEKQIAEAEKRGRDKAVTDLGQRLVRAEFRALAAGRIEGLDELLDDLNLAKFVTEDGEPDAAAIQKAVARLAPAPVETNTRQPGPRPDLSQGGSNQNMALNSDDLTEALRAAVGG
jgi:hypothetical protein